MIDAARVRVSWRQYALLMALLAAVVSFETWIRVRAPITNSDTPLVLANISKTMDPSLYPRSANPNLSGQYIPGYQEVVRFLAGGSGSAWTGMLRLFPICLVIFLVGAWLLLRETGMPVAWLAIFALAASAVRDSGGGEYWGVSFQAEMLARYPFLALALIAFIPFMRAWPRISTRNGIISLAVIGLLANLHPPSAIGWEIVVGMMILVSENTWRRKIIIVLAGGIAATILALPAMAPSAAMISSAGESLSSLPFPKYVVQIRKTQEELFPWFMNVAFGGKYLPQRSALWVVLALYLAAMVVWIRAWLRAPAEKRLGRGMWLALAFIQWFPLFALTRYQAFDLSLVMLLYFICVRKEGQPTRIEWFALVIAAAVNLVSWGGSAGLRLVWQLGELRQITFPIVNFSRVSRFVYLPIWLLVGFWVARHARRQTIVPLLALVIAVFTPVDYCRNLAYILLGFMGTLGTEWRAHTRARWQSAIVFAAVSALAFANVYVRIVDQGYLDLTWRWAWVVGAAVLTLDLALIYPARTVIAAALLVLSIFVLIATSGSRLPDEFQFFRQYVHDAVTCVTQAPVRELWKWARTETPKDALFYVHDSRNFAEYFAGMAQRTVVYSFKGAGALTSEYPPAGPETAALSEEIDLPYSNKDSAGVIKTAIKFGADYALLIRGMKTPPPDMAPVVFDNGNFRIVKVPGTIKHNAE